MVLWRFQERSSKQWLKLLHNKMIHHLSFTLVKKTLKWLTSHKVHETTSELSFNFVFIYANVYKNSFLRQIVLVLIFIFLFECGFFVYFECFEIKLNLSNFGFVKTEKYFSENCNFTNFEFLFLTVQLFSIFEFLSLIWKFLAFSTSLFIPLLKTLLETSRHRCHR